MNKLKENSSSISRFSITAAFALVVAALCGVPTAEASDSLPLRIAAYSDQETRMTLSKSDLPVTSELPSQKQSARNDSFSNLYLSSQVDIESKDCRLTVRVKDPDPTGEYRLERLAVKSSYLRTFPDWQAEPGSLGAWSKKSYKFKNEKSLTLSKYDCNATQQLRVSLCKSGTCESETFLFYPDTSQSAKVAFLKFVDSLGSLEQWVALRDSKIWAQWANRTTDGCSKAPDKERFFGDDLSVACHYHDFLYRTSKEIGLWNETNRKSYDKSLAFMLSLECNGDISCYQNADVYYEFVRSCGNAQDWGLLTSCAAPRYIAVRTFEIKAKACLLRIWPPAVGKCIGNLLLSPNPRE